MELKQLIADEDAVSPVIGVILMVAITVILAAVIGTFVLGLGEQVQSTTPQASFTFDYAESKSGTKCTNDPLDDSGASDGASVSGEGQLTVTHDGGDKIDASTVTLNDGEGNSDTWNACASNAVSSITAGDSADPEVDSDDTIRVVWTSSGGGNSGTLGKWTGPDA